ncbi:hypothetical protein, partial [Acetobacter indonesiensis]
TFGGNNADPRVLTDESYAILLAGSLPNYLKISDSCGSIAIQSGGYYLLQPVLLASRKTIRQNCLSIRGMPTQTK